MTEQLLYEAQEKFTSLTVKEFTPSGVRLSFNLQGRVTGRYNAARLETVEALMKPDGTGEFEFLIVDRTPEGEVVLIKGKGLSRQVSPSALRIEGKGTFQTSSKRLSWLNGSIGRMEGDVDQEKGEVALKVFAST